MGDLKKQLNIPNQFQQTARMLIDQQMWCWGCDVRRSEGNLFLIYGAQKRPSPNPSHHSGYIFHATEEVVVNLWGWGLWIACPHRGSLFISRSHFQISHTHDVVFMPDAWCKNDLPLKALSQDKSNIAHARDLLATAFHWMGTYETWLRTQVEPDYREHILTQWTQRKRYKGGIPATEMAEHWFNLSTNINQ